MPHRQTGWTAIQAAVAAISAAVAIIAAVTSATAGVDARTAAQMTRMEHFAAQQHVAIESLSRRVTQLERPAGRPGPFRSPGRN